MVVKLLIDFTVEIFFLFLLHEKKQTIRNKISHSSSLLLHHGLNKKGITINLQFFLATDTCSNFRLLFHYGLIIFRTGLCTPLFPNPPSVL